MADVIVKLSEPDRAALGCAEKLVFNPRSITARELAVLIKGVQVDDGPTIRYANIKEWLAELATLEPLAVWVLAWLALRHNGIERTIPELDFLALYALTVDFEVPAAEPEDEAASPGKDAEIKS